MPTFEFESHLAAPAEAVLEDLTMAGVNAELSPLVRMTAPEPFASQGILEWPQRQNLFRSWILLFGVVPIDRHEFYFDEIRPQEGFSERSSSIANRVWSHRRTIIPEPGGCLVIDTVRHESRIPLMDRILHPVYRLVFRHRHQVLRQRHGQRTVAA